MITLYESTTGIVHLVQGGYICNAAIGNVYEYYPSSVFKGTRKQITCKHCRLRLN